MLESREPLADLMRRWRKSQNGAVAVTASLGLAVAMTSMGYAVDVHVMRSTASRLQDVADAAALAGARLATTGGSQSAVKLEAERVAMAMLGTSQGAGGRVAVTAAMGPQPEVTVQVKRDVALFFDTPFDGSQPEMVRGATAVGASKTAVCMLVMEPLEDQAFSMQGTPDLVGPDCVVQVNSSSANAMHVGGSASVVTKAVYVRGKPSGGGGGGGDVKPAPTFGRPVMPDPIGSRISWPQPAGCDYSNGTIKKGSATLNPGVYCGGIGATTQGELTLRPGLYVIRTGGLSLGSGGTIKGSGGVTIVLLDPEGVVDIGSKGSLTLEAPKTGPWADIAIAVKPQPTRNTSNLQGGGEMVLDGIIYMPSQRLHLTGGGDVEASMKRRMLVVNSIQMNGNGQIRLKGDPNVMSVGGTVYLKS